jgi:hypothetical protein
MTVEETLEQNGELECPHGCGHMIRDLWDYDWGSSEEMLVECEECEKPLTIHRCITVTYSATPDEVSS